MLDMVHRCLIVVEGGIMSVAVGHLGLVCGARIVLFVTLPCGFLVMSGCLIVVVGRSRVVLRTAEARRRQLVDFQGSFDLRIGIRWLGKCTEMVLGIVRAGFIAIVQRLQRMPVCDQGLMRSMGVVFPGLVVPRRFAVEVGRLLMMEGRGGVMFRCMAFVGHDVSGLIASRDAR